ncbi:MAG: shikimate dehydrogenase, partial [Luteolibacter sp.]
MKEVYTIDDLASRELLDAGTGKPAKLAVIGHPIAHSASPKMHQAALDAEGIDARYIRVDIEPGQVGEAFARMRALGFIGCNVTVPHKVEAMEHCIMDGYAGMMGAVNTIRFDDKTTSGFNTDGPGFESAILDDFDVSLRELKVAVAGAGGGAGSAITTVCFLSKVPKLVMINRTLGKLEPIVTTFTNIRKDFQVIPLSFDDPSLADECLSCDLIVNTSSVGLKIGDPSILPASCLKKEHLVYDTIYQPPLTPLLAIANELGCRTSNGLSMLIH